MAQNHFPIKSLNKIFLRETDASFYCVNNLGTELNNQLDNWLGQAELSYGPARGIIAVIIG